MRLLNKVAVVTGGGLGMGRAAALSLAAEGARVIVGDINVEAGEAAVADNRRAGGQAAFVPADVAQAAEVAALMQAAVDRYGGLDCLYSNAAIQLHDEDAVAHELAEAVWDRVMAVNLRGVWLCAKYALPHLLARGGGSIIHAASPTGLLARAPHNTAYSVSKGGVITLTRVMAAAYGPHNIRVNAIVPGPMDTPLIAPLLTDESVRRRLAASTMLGRLGQAEDIAGLVVFLASDESSYCTGGLYMADGGATAR
jgi:NAD(P)-dependent dehydrogenase (short-subunit alcohol dehydrogenase family)